MHVMHVMHVMHAMHVMHVMHAYLPRAVQSTYAIDALIIIFSL